MRNIQRAQLVGAQPTTIQQQNDQAITPHRRSGRSRGLHEPLGLLQVERLWRRTSQCMLQTKSIEHVALSAPAAPGVFEQPIDMSQIFRLLTASPTQRPSATI